MPPQASIQETFQNQFAQTVTTTAGGVGLAFGFPATWIQLVNDGPVSVYMSINSTNPASTGAYSVRSGELYSPTLQAPTSGMGLNTTTTSTNPPDMPSVRVAAAGG